MKSTLLSAFLFVGFPTHTLAESQSEQTSAHVRWHWDQETSAASINIDLSKTLSSNQIKTLNSGFSTFSLVKLSYINEATEIVSELSKCSCTVRLDTWDEIYDITKLEPPPQMETSKDLQSYFQLCLQTVIQDPKTLQLFKTEGGSIQAVLQVEQISAAQSLKIKEWLINQQSVVMQGLFAHMLGKITKKDTIEMTLTVPPMPQNFIMLDSTRPVYKVAFE